jgi:orotate phosphoribosyltransferase
VEQYKEAFIEFMVKAEVLRFGDFTAKSGRKTPYFIDAGRYQTGGQMRELAGFYADAIAAQGVAFDFLFGPAYKGIPLCVATAMALSERGRDVPFCFNRKEAKDHGEGGVLIGHAPVDGERALIIEDVTTAGTSIRETLPLLSNIARVQAAGLLVSVDRLERGRGEQSALSELQTEFSMTTFAIVTIDEVVEHLAEHSVDGRQLLSSELQERIEAYRKQWGARA